VLVDLREGKVTYPLMVALERDRELRALLSEHLERGAASLDPRTAERALAAIHKAGGAAEARALAKRLVVGALEDISTLPDKPETRALAAVAQAMVERRS
jgi:octaprenyl-diphosphate synthase